MSAYKRIKCKIANKECLIEALNNLELKHVVHDKPEALTGFEGRTRANKAEIIVDRKDLNKAFTGASNDLGFSWNEANGAYDMICSDYDVSLKIPERVMQSYAMAVIQKAAAANHFTLKQEENTQKIKSRSRQKIKLIFGKVI